MHLQAVLLLIGIVLGMAHTTAQAAGYRVGVAKVDITPNEPMWMAGFGFRDKPAEGKVHSLYAKALAIEDDHGRRVVFVTTDLIRMPVEVAEPVAERICNRFLMQRQDICLTASHTHCAPVLYDSSMPFYELGAEYKVKAKRYTEWLTDRLVEVASEALQRLQPARLSYGVGRATFAVNRRQNIEAEVGTPGFVPAGPVDHDVPVLRVVAPNGTLKAVLFGYACHCTTMAFYKWCGDYAGYAQANLERAHPKAIAMFFAGCGGDINPLPRGKLGLCREYGIQLSGAVEQVLARDMRSIYGPLASTFKRIRLPFANVPTRAELEKKRAAAKADYTKHNISRLIARLDAGQAFPTSHPYPIQVIQLGELTIIVLAGEVLVDYSLRLKSELGRPQTWVIAYANDVRAYIPSRRVLAEGGYEAERSMWGYGHASSWAPAVEDLIVSTVHEMVRGIRSIAK